MPRVLFTDANNESTIGRCAVLPSDSVKAWINFRVKDTGDEFPFSDRELSGLPDLTYGDPEENLEAAWDYRRYIRNLPRSILDSYYQTIITRVSIKDSVNASFSNSLGDLIYQVVYGDRPTQVTVSGLSFYQYCEDPPLNWDDTYVLNKDVPGIVRLMRLYKTFKSSNNIEQQVQLSIQPGISFQGPLLGLGTGLSDTKNHIAQYQLTMVAIPSVKFIRDIDATDPSNAPPTDARGAPWSRDDWLQKAERI